MEQRREWTENEKEYLKNNGWVEVTAKKVITIDGQQLYKGDKYWSKSIYTINNSPSNKKWKHEPINMQNPAKEMLDKLKKDIKQQKIEISELLKMQPSEIYNLSLVDQLTYWQRKYEDVALKLKYILEDEKDNTKKETWRVKKVPRTTEEKG